MKKILIVMISLGLLAGCGIKNGFQEGQHSEMKNEENSQVDLNITSNSYNLKSEDTILDFSIEDGVIRDFTANGQKLNYEQNLRCQRIVDVIGESNFIYTLQKKLDGTLFKNGHDYEPEVNEYIGIIQTNNGKELPAFTAEYTIELDDTSSNLFRAKDYVFTVMMTNEQLINYGYLINLEPSDEEITKIQQELSNQFQSWFSYSEKFEPDNIETQELVIADDGIGLQTKFSSIDVEEIYALLYFEACESYQITASN